MPDPTLSSSEFAAKIKAKYPEYSNVDDNELALRVVAKHPEYRGQVSFAPNAGLASPGKNAVQPQYAPEQASVAQKLGAMAREGTLGFASGVGLPETQNASDFSLLPGLKHMVTHPIDSAQLVGGAIYDASANQLKQAKADIQAGGVGGYTSAAIDAAGAIPLVGPGAVAAGKEIGSGNSETAAHGAGSALGQLAMLGLATKPGVALADAAVSKLAPLTDAIDSGLANSAARLNNSALRPGVKAFRYDKNPGRGVTESGIVAATKGGLADKIEQSTANISSQTDQLLASPQNAAKTVDLSQAINKPIQDAIAQAAKTGSTSTIKQLQELQQGLTQNYDVATGQFTGPKNLQLDPLAATEVKRDVGGISNWRADADPVVNTVKKQIYGNVRSAIEAQVPEVGPLNKRWADLIEANKALANTEALAQKHNIFSFMDAATAALAGGASHSPEAAIAAVLARRALGSTVAKTGGAQILNAPRGVSVRSALANRTAVIASQAVGEKERQ